MADVQTIASLPEIGNHGAGDNGLDWVIAAVLREFYVNDYGVSSWARTSRIDCETASGEPRSYFLKVCHHETWAFHTLSTHNAAERVYGEYRSMKEIYDTLPSAVPTPRGYGPCADTPGTYLYVCDYVPVTHELPDPVALGRKLAEFHHSSKSPNGLFGFHCPTFDGDQIINTAWESSWTEFFKKRIHGDLWESNIGTDENTDDIVFWDACSYYAHHEREVAIWRCAHHQMTDEKYRREYFKHYPPSEPQEEADDRNRLYPVEILMNNGLSFPGAVTRQQAVNELQYLINKYVEK